MDGDTVFAVATLHKAMRDEVYELTDIGLTAADCLARAIARGVYEAKSLGNAKSYRETFGGRNG